MINRGYMRYLALFVICLLCVFMSFGQSDDKLKKKKLDFLIGYFSYESFLSNSSVESVRDSILDVLPKLFVYEKFSVRNAQIITNPLQRSIDEAREQSNRQFNLTSTEELKKQLSSTYSVRKIGNSVVIPLRGGYTIEGIIKSISDEEVIIHGKAPVEIKDILLPERLLYRGNKGQSDYLNRVAESKYQEKADERELRFKELQGELLKKYIAQNKLNIAFKLRDEWGSIVDYIGEKISKNKQKIIIKNAIKKEKKKSGEKKQSKQEFESVISTQELIFHYTDNSRKVEDVILSIERIDRQQKNLTNFKEEEAKKKEKDLLRTSREKRRDRALRQSKEDYVSNRFWVDVIISLVVGVVVSFILFFVLNKIPIFRMLLQNRPKSISLNSLEEKVGRKKKY